MYGQLPFRNCVQQNSPVNSIKQLQNLPKPAAWKDSIPHTQSVYLHHDFVLIFENVSQVYVIKFL